MAAFFNFIAFLVFGLSVANTVGSGIIDPNIVDPAVIFAALTGAIIWNLVTWFWRRAERLEIMLVSSRETGRWVLPKGWPMKGIKPHQTAAREALEEAGILGRVAKTALGDYSYAKRLENGSVQICQVHVFAFEVTRERNFWLEKHERTRKWFAVADAAEAVKEPELREAILKFEMVAMAEPKNAKSKNRH